jgi:hypothetical protein
MLAGDLTRTISLELAQQSPEASPQSQREDLGGYGFDAEACQFFLKPLNLHLIVVQGNWVGVPQVG